MVPDFAKLVKGKDAHGPKPQHHSSQCQCQVDRLHIILQVRLSATG